MANHSPTLRFLLAFILQYHYYRAYPAYNTIRVFVSAYVWMTGFGNFLYFDKKQDFTIDRAISMWLRINYFPLLLSTCLGVKLELYYVVPLHTAGFFITMITCYVAAKLEVFKPTWNHDKRTMVAIGLCLLVHVLFYEIPAFGPNLLGMISKEYSFRFQSDKYTAWVGILSGFFWSKFRTYINWCYGSEEMSQHQMMCMWGQRVAGVALIAGWWGLFGSITDKYTYNPIHPYVFWLPAAGWLMLRNSSKYLTELHCGAMEFFGKITLETYVLQFHLFMCRDVQFIPILIPNSGPDGPLLLKTLNMLVCGGIFVPVAWWARRVTVSTQNSVTDLMHLMIKGPPEPEPEEEGVALTKKTSSITEDAPISVGQKMQEV
jgi:hypothetical protein